MSFDINVFVLGQEKPSKFPFLSKIKYEINVTKYDSWQFIYQLKGMWYYLGKESDGLFTAKPICDSDFEIEENKLPIPHWIKNEDITYHLTPLVIKEEFMEEFKTILDFLINKSPFKLIAFLAKYQGGNQEIIEGIIPQNEFFELLESKAILFNVCYMIKG